MGVNTSLPNSVTYVVSNFGGLNPRFPGGQSFLVILPRLPRTACGNSTSDKPVGDLRCQPISVPFAGSKRMTTRSIAIPALLMVAPTCLTGCGPAFGDQHTRAMCPGTRFGYWAR